MSASAVYLIKKSGKTELVYVSSDLEAAKDAASRFSQNRMFFSDTYEVRPFGVFAYHPENVMSESMHQALPYLDDPLYYVFGKDVFEETGTWVWRDYLSPDYAASMNKLFPTVPTYFIRADTEEEAIERFEATLKKLNR